jgi:hypothetical protein
MAELTQDLAAILQQQELVKSKMNEAKEESNVSLARDLQGELEILTAKQLQLLAEQSQIIKTQRRTDRFYTMKGVNENGDGTGTFPKPSVQSVPRKISLCWAPWDQVH